MVLGAETLSVSQHISAPGAEPTWQTVVWDDPVNLISYVIYVFQTYFGFPLQRAEALTMQVHNFGKAVVATGSKEQMEKHVQALHTYGLWATLKQAGGH